MLFVNRDETAQDPRYNYEMSTSHEPGSLSTRILDIEVSATLAVDARQRELRAQGLPIISLGAGEPDFPTPAHVVEAAAQATRDIHNHKYSNSTGLGELHEAIAAKVEADAGISIDPSTIIVTNGAKQAVFEAWATLINPGDNVLLPSPYWVTYPAVIQFFGGNVTRVFAGPEQSFKVTVEQLEAARTEKTKALLLCSPTNPTGAVYNREEIRAIGAWAKDHGIWLVVDEIYEHLTYDGAKTAYPLAEMPELLNHTLVIGGVSKSFAMTGWRVGWIYGAPKAIARMKALHSHLTGNVNNVAQRAVIAALTGGRECVEYMREGFARRRRIIVDGLREVRGFNVQDPEGAFYVFADVRDLLGSTISGKVIGTTTDLATLLLEEANVACVPGEAFGTPGFLRFSYALSDEDLKEALRRIKALLG